MPYFSKDVVEKIKDLAKLEEVAAEFMKLEKSGANLFGKCPSCGKSGKGKGMSFSLNKQIFKCYSCDTSGKGPVKFLMVTQKQSFTAALEYLANKYGVSYNEEYKQILKENQAAQRKNGKGKKSFADLQLKASGLTTKDIKATVFKEDSDKTYEVLPFTEGTLNEYYHLVPGYGNDMIIWYYNLEGHPVKYLPKNRKTPEPFFRVRFQNPEERKDRNGKPFKYYSPPSSGTHLFIPQKIRKLYQLGNQIETLYIQEGEKKSEKACKHDILSVGVMGIHNIGSNNVMPKDLQLLIQKCNVKNVVFMLDSDWEDISANLKIGDNPQKRPLTFFYAVKNFKEYMLSMRNIGINLEVYFSAVKKTETNEKGLDDVLAGSLKNKEAEFLTDLNEAMNTKGGHGTYCEIHKITALTDYQIKNFWKLNSPQEFCEHHKDILVNIPDFKIARTRYRFNENEKFELAEPVLPEERYWEIDEKERVSFNYKRAYMFLRNRGYGRLKMAGKWRYVQYKDHVVQNVDRTDIKFYVTEITEQIASEKVQNMIYQGGHFYLGDHSLENLKFFDLLFEEPSKHAQNMHFHNKFLKITKHGIAEHQPSERTHTVWNDKIIDFNVDVIKTDMVTFEQVTQDMLQGIEDPELQQYFADQPNLPYSMNLTEIGQKCHFLQFLINSSNFQWRKSKNIANLKPDHFIDTSMHLLNKLTTLGYLCHRFFDPGTAKAIIAMDGKLSEVGASNGRSGKSLLGNAVGKIVPQVYIGGKTKKITEDQFLFEEVTEKTENVFFDDIRANIDFEFFFPNITGRWKINAKGVGRWTMPTAQSPKLLFTTNHAINGEGSSFSDRQHHVVFSDFYNDYHKPIDDFGMLFFDEWDKEQWNYYYNLIALSLKLYFEYGLITAPQKDIRLRKLRQLMGEEFLTWAEEYFAPERETGTQRDDVGIINLDKKIPRKEMYDEFKSRLRGRMLDYYSATRFGKCVKFFCEYKNLHFNPHKPDKNDLNISDYLNNGGKIFIGQEDKSSGVEYFTIGTIEFNAPF